MNREQQIEAARARIRAQHADATLSAAERAVELQGARAEQRVEREHRNGA